MSAYAIAEMAEDLLTIMDTEESVLNGQIIQVEKDDSGGTKYILVRTEPILVIHIEEKIF